MTFAEELRAWRARLGCTQVEAAAKIGVTYHAYEAWERGRQQPSHTNIIRRLLDYIESEDWRSGSPCAKGR
jgi:transcriptional regulator with XRE-family HTH domain